MKVRNKIVSLLLTLCLMMGVLPAAASAADNTPTLLALGDGIALGYQISESERFTNLVASHYGLTEVNKAFGSATAADVCASVTGGELDEDLARASMIVLTCGGMDMAELLFAETAVKYNQIKKTNLTGADVASIVRGEHPSIKPNNLIFMGAIGSAVKGFSTSAVFKTGLAAYEKNLTAIFTYIREKNPTAQVVMPTQINPFQRLKPTNYAFVYENVDLAVKEINAVINKHAPSLNYVVADIYPTFTNTSENLLLGTGTGLSFSYADFFPNATGHAKIAQIINALNLTITAPPASLPFEPGVPAVYYTEADVSLTDGTVKLALNEMDGSMSVSAAFYNEAGKMVGVAYQTPAAGDTEITLTAALRSEATSVRVFLTNTSFAPVGSVLTPAA